MKTKFNYRGLKIYCSLLKKAAVVPQTQHKNQSLDIIELKESSADKIFFSFEKTQSKVWAYFGEKHDIVK